MLDMISLVIVITIHLGSGVFSSGKISANTIFDSSKTSFKVISFYCIL